MGKSGSGNCHLQQSAQHDTKTPYCFFLKGYAEKSDKKYRQVFVPRDTLPVVAKSFFLAFFICWPCSRRCRICRAVCFGQLSPANSAKEEELTGVISSTQGFIPKFSLCCFYTARALLYVSSSVLMWKPSRYKPESIFYGIKSANLVVHGESWTCSCSHGILMSYMCV